LRPMLRMTTRVRFSTPYVITPELAAELLPLMPAVVGDPVPVGLSHEIDARFPINFSARARGLSRRLRRTEAFVTAACAAPAGMAWCCLSCAQLLANDTQLAFHLERGRHVVAMVCGLHGAEVPPDIANPVPRDTTL
jgi:hypothetical protein